MGWCTDIVGDKVLRKGLAQMNLWRLRVACGLGVLAAPPTTVAPFILRNVRLQAGVDSVMTPSARRA